MELYDDSVEVKKDKKNKTPLFIKICIVLLVILTIFIIAMIIYIKNTMVIIKIDGVKNYKIEDVLKLDENVQDGKLYIPIRGIAKFLGYEDYRGDYKYKSENSDKCYVKNDYETAMFTLGSSTLIKTRGNSDYEYVDLDESVFEKDGELYTTIDGIQKAFNIEFHYSEDGKRINIYTMDFLVEKYAKYLKLEEKEQEPSDEFSDKKAIFEGMMVVKNKKQYGVLDIEAGEAILELKYDKVIYIPHTTDFIVVSNQKYGIVSKDATTKVKCVYDEIKIMDNQNDLYLVKQNNLYGAIKSTGEVIVYPEYQQVGINDMDKYAQNGVENQYVLLNEVIPVKLNNLWGFFNIKGEKLTEIQYTGVGCSTTKVNDSYPMVVMPSHNIVIVENNKYYNLMNNEGQMLLKDFVLDSTYLKSDIVTGENTFYMTYNGKTQDIDEVLTKQGL